jgi:hypothetical protein
MRDELTGGWRKPHNEELIICALYNLISMIKPHDETGGACSVHWGDKKKHTKFWLEILKGRDNFEDLSIDGRILRKQGKRVWIGFM